MSKAASVTDFLAKRSIEFELVKVGRDESGHYRSETGPITQDAILRAVTMRADGARYLAILPQPYLLDFEVLKRVLGLDLTIVTDYAFDPSIQSFKPAKLPALPLMFGMVGIVDESIFKRDTVYLFSDEPNLLVKLTIAQYKSLVEQDERASFACGDDKLYSRKSAQQDVTEAVSQFTPIRIKQRIDETFDLPAMPDIAQEIMRLRVDPSADAKKLGAIVARDPSLAAQIISWASSPYYGYKGTIDSVETAISRVLGFDLVMNLALGISIGKSLNVPDEGPLGIHAFWRQAVYSASLVEKLCLMIPPKQRPERGLAYLAGLLHNFGHLLLGHLFSPQFKMINDYIEANPEIRLEDIEHFVIGVTHQEIGAWLMKNWHMPDELIVAVRWHHQEEFWSKHAVYSNLVLLSNRLLKRIEMGDEVAGRLPQSTLELLELDEQQVNTSFEQLLEERESLDLMSKQLVA